MSSNTGNRRRRPTLVDLAGVLLVVAVVGLAAYKLLAVNPRYAAVTKTYLMTVLIEEVRQPTVDEIREGIQVKEGDSNQVLGRIVSREVRPARRYVETADGRVVLAPVPEKYDVLVVLEGQAQVTPGAIIMGGQEIRIGFTPALKGQRFLVRGTVVGLEERK
ncbi:MAG: DUF4330 domain-containing protein [Firmicutes bacterium]|nr:DUF4330 domain-containing protein [Bacillota bacterium]